MHAEQRRARILAEINRTGGARITELGTRLGVSGVTARRDVEALAGRGLIARVRGGAMALTPGPALAAGPGPAGDRAPDASAAGRSAAGGHRAKAAIARTAARLTRPAEAIGILAGSTTTLLARELLEVPGLTVVTNSLPVADAFHHEGLPGQTVVLLGGRRTRSGALAGPIAERTAAGLNLDVVFLGVYGMAVCAGFTTPDLAEARTATALLAAARRVVVLADHRKWGVTSAAVIAPLERADVLVTDTGLTQSGRSALRHRVGELIVADVA
ncbi:DeoR/GlpR family DNA-binding transcription regulator [Paractinoplanes ferrugineus]|uniref:DeoR family transcriptional regulator n=1 Tax=Paractinoplanes ferrugineus TaxID=113564 RepID=A0A919M8N3_9ACTN|nr:DeoR/GlpR family DNA-binding transcription regulator [Actinoplanes ferrugineus]GIE10651.1 DeoR family transcriptional regulator [Actinoplanes ferrugineus]